MFRIIIVFIYWICTASTEPNVGQGAGSEKIIHGDKIPIQAAPYQVGIVVDVVGQGHQYFCGGSIVSSDYILTAGHCAGIEPDKYIIRAGTSEWQNGGSTHSVLKVVRHENYGFNNHSTVENDLALMQVDPPFQLDDTRRVVELFSDEHGLKDGDAANVTGWGKTENGSISLDLESITISILGKEACNNAYAADGGVPDGEICAADPKGIKDMCNGDSGGPLIVKGLQVGIVSWSGPACALRAFPGVYTEIAHYVTWINKHLKS